MNPTLFDHLPLMPRPAASPSAPAPCPDAAGPLLTITVDGEPVAKGRPRVRIMRMGGNPVPQLYAPKETQDYEDYVRVCARNALRETPAADQRMPLDECSIGLRVRVYVPIPASWSDKKKAAALRGEVLPLPRPDADNYLKMACDSLNGIAYRDDALITDMHVIKRYSDNPRMQIEVFA